MSKSILIIDTPECCADCKLKIGLFCGENGNSLHDYIHYDESLNDKPSWCPLKPLPNKVSHSEIEEVCDYWEVEGYNKAIDEILGEEYE